MEFLTMPISSNDFEKTESEPSRLLIDFLRSNRRFAYSLNQLQKMLESEGRVLDKKDIDKMLSLMEYAGMVESKIIAGVPYYRYLDYSFFRPPTRPR
jgi:hypothetical protein